MRYVSFAIPVCLLMYSYAGAQQAGGDCKYTISGKIIGTEHKEVLCFSQVYIPELKLSAVADADGFYTFEHICPGEYTLACTHLGFKTEQVKVTVTNKNVH